jgi:hypothetical protein
MESRLQQPWLEFIRNHIPQILGTGLFMDARLTKVLVDEQDGGVTYSIQYKARSREALETYYTDHAESFRKETHNIFGDKILFFRTELDVIDEYTVHPNLN